MANTGTNGSGADLVQLLAGVTLASSGYVRDQRLWRRRINWWWLSGFAAEIGIISLLTPAAGCDIRFEMLLRKRDINDQTSGEVIMTKPPACKGLSVTSVGILISFGIFGSNKPFGRLINETFWGDSFAEMRSILISKTKFLESFWHLTISTI